jgi:Domain of unknown function (DUF1918)
MDGKVGDRIVIATDKVGQPAREGQILDVIDHASGTEFVVRWDDGHESAIRPHGGNARVVKRPKARSRG